jgi:hypothetical protein
MGQEGGAYIVEEIQLDSHQWTPNERVDLQLQFWQLVCQVKKKVDQHRQGRHSKLPCEGLMAGAQQAYNGVAATYFARI